MTKKSHDLQLASAGFEQIGATHDVGHAVLCVVHSGGEVKGIHAIRAIKNEITMLALEVVPLQPEQAVLELDAHSLHLQPERACAATGGQTVAAKARVDTCFTA